MARRLALAQGSTVHGLTDLLLETGATGFRLYEGGQAVEGEEPGEVRVLLHRAGLLPANPDAFDIALTCAADPPAPWVFVKQVDAEASRLASAFARQPVAASVAAQLFRLSGLLDFEAALLVESFAYSTLLASSGFRAWRAEYPAPRARHDVGPPILLEREKSRLVITLNHPNARNVMTAAMRDALCEALEFAVADPESAPVTLRARGVSFSTGGDLREFGSAQDAGAAHLIRTLRSPARLLHRIADRVTVILHGPCIGSGIEIPLAAGRVEARSGTRFRLPEVGMGLIPGAGGTVTLPRRIGPHRACWMAIGGSAIDLTTALDWGLIDAVRR